MRNVRVRAAGVAIAVIVVAAIFAGRKRTAPPGGERPPLAADAGAPPAAARVERPAADRPSRALPPAAAARKAVVPVGRPTVEPGPAGGAIEGTVLSLRDGAGIEGAEITFQRDDGASSVRSGAGGAFTFEAPRPGRHRVAAVAAEGYLPFAPAWGHSTLFVDLAAGQRVRGVAIQLRPAVEYTVTVLDAGRKPAPGAELRVLGAQTGELALLPLPDRYQTDARGEARVRSPDGAVIEARREGSAPGRAAIDFAAQVSRRVFIRLGPAGERAAAVARIAGRATDEAREPVSGALVVARAQRGRGERTVEAMTDPDGRFALEGLPEVAHDLEVRAEGFAPWSREVEAPADVEVLLRRGGKLIGRVVDARTGAPVPSFTVQVWRKPRPLGLDLHASRAFVSPTGEYELTSLGSGEATVVIAAPDYAPSDELPVTISEGATAARADASLRPGSRLRGKVLERQGAAPIAGALVTIEGRRSMGTGPALATSTVTDERGSFQVAGLAPGPVALFVSAEGHHARIVTAVVPDAGEAPEVEVLLTKLKPGEEPSVELVGIGAVLRAVGEVLVIERVLAGGGAAEVGLQPGDHILEIAGRKVVEVGFEGSMNAIRGPEGTAVMLTVRPRAAAGTRVMLVPRRQIRG